MNMCAIFGLLKVRWVDRSGNYATAAPPAPRTTRLAAPIVLHSPFTGLPLPAAMQPVNATATDSSVTEASVRPPPPAQVHSGFHCSNCGAFNPAVGQTGEAFYVVTAGHEVGIFTNWEKVQPLVSGVAHACHKKYRSRADAEAAFADALAEGKMSRASTMAKIDVDDDMLKATRALVLLWQPRPPSQLHRHCTLAFPSFIYPSTLVAQTYTPPWTRTFDFRVG
ncbi:hypothetical protein ARMSODRAFT_1020273 [Armillaria solidipes]|uniref:Ribonuclease H1 N-terminal domain-containing protein n=1 Tax=Armillaria solidipes TaxID=1076256 RepID=A0A2H3BXI2_9AGAR|nr:hypothetical protein ARMSODRAFT_1020273 [Armillaria solidipes]